MRIIDAVVRANQRHAQEQRARLGYRWAPKATVVTCLDPRLSNLGKLLRLRDADLDVIRMLGPAVTDEVLAELIVSTRVFGTTQILLVSDTGGGSTFTAAPLRGFAYEDPLQQTREQMQKVRSHPWIDAAIPVRGFVLDLDTGVLSEVDAAPR